MKERFVNTLKAVALVAMTLAFSANAQMTDGKMMDHDKMDHAAHMKMMGESERQAAVSQRGKEIMPFTLAATTHIFTKSGSGGVQQVVTKKEGDDVQIQLIRQHLQEIKDQFLKGDFSGPSHSH